MSSIGVKSRNALLKQLLLGSFVFNEVPSGWESVISLAGPDAWADNAGRDEVALVSSCAL